MNTYTYLFPFELIPIHSRVLIYGAGDVGLAYLEQLLMTNYATVMGMVDRKHEEMPTFSVPVYNPNRIKELEFDYIILAFKQGNFANDIRQKLMELGIAKEKIIYRGARPVVSLTAENDQDSKQVSYDYAFRQASLSIALKLGPGLGDAVIKKRLVMEIIRMAPEVAIDIYTPSAWAVRSFYSDVPAVKNAIDDSGRLYQANQQKYSLAMSVFFMIQIDYVDNANLTKLNPNFAEQIRTHGQNHQQYGLALFPATQNSIHFQRAKYKGWNCYSLYSYTDVFHITDSKVNIPLRPEWELEFCQLDLGRYITFNFGNGMSSKGNKNIVSKQWSEEYFRQWLVLFKERYPHIKVVQLGDKSTSLIPKADKYLLGENIELVKYVLKNSLVHLDIEGGLMHLATQLGTKCICLLGPTQAYLFSYPQNINIVADKCQDCYCLHDNTYECAKGQISPECMESITPERVMTEFDNYLK